MFEVGQPKSASQSATPNDINTEWVVPEKFSRCLLYPWKFRILNPLSADNLILPHFLAGNSVILDCIIFIIDFLTDVILYVVSFFVSKKPIQLFPNFMILTA